MRLNLCPPALILVTSSLLDDWQAAATRGPLVVIRPGNEADAGLLAHELTHVRRWWYVGLAASALAAIAGWLAGSITIAGYSLPLWSLAPAGMALPSILYLTWPRYRAAEEIAAYRVQAMYYPDDRRPLFARFIAERYGLCMSADEALIRLQ